MGALTGQDHGAAGADAHDPGGVFKQFHCPVHLLRLHQLDGLVDCIHSLAADVNEACREDGKHTTGLLGFLLLSLITCGIYSIIWWYGTAERLADYGRRNNAPGVEIDGVKFLLWYLVGSLVCGLGSLYAMYLHIKSLNAVCADYNRRAFTFNV